MEIKLQRITIRQLVEGFTNNDEEGVTGYGGRLNIRPKYQREFVYDDKQKMAVIDTVFKGYPLNVMYWVETGDEAYELLDGQQRTMSICSYFAGEFFVDLDGNLKGYGNLTRDERERFLGYNLMVYICTGGTDSERIEWFQTINIAGEKLTGQEILNAIYCGEWVTELKRKFSKTGCVAMKLGGDYVKGSAIRQDVLHTVLGWISGGDVAAYMARHQRDTNADREWQYFQRVVAWIKSVFPRVRREMKDVGWGVLYDKYKERDFSATELEARVAALIEDEDVSRKAGVYPYVLSGDERQLSIRAFTPRMKREAYERQHGICPSCGLHFDLSGMEGDHITPWHEGGRTVADNCQMLCRDCNRRKGGRWVNEAAVDKQIGSAIAYAGTPDSGCLK